MPCSPIFKFNFRETKILKEQLKENQTQLPNSTNKKGIKRQLGVESEEETEKPSEQMASKYF
jgi:hypothetical protein